MAIGDHRFNAVTIAVTSSGTPLKHVHVAMVFPVTLQTSNDRRYDGNAVDAPELNEWLVSGFVTDLANNRA